MITTKMSIVLDKDQGVESELEERIGLECPYCGVYAHMSPQSVPDAAALLRDKPKHVGLVYQCDACHAPVFSAFHRPRIRRQSRRTAAQFCRTGKTERTLCLFLFAEAHGSLVPRGADLLLEQQLQCVCLHVPACGSQCLSTLLGEGGKLRAFEEVMVAQDIAGIDDDTFAPIKDVLFGTGSKKTCRF